MSINDTLYIETELSQEEILKLFIGNTDPKVEFGTIERSSNVMYWVDTKYYGIECDKPFDWEYEDFGFKPNIKFHIDFNGILTESARRYEYVTEGRMDILTKTAYLLHKINSHMVLEYEGCCVLARKEELIRLSKEIWTPELLKLIKLPYELLDGYIK
jgi:hypothetical protein